jgi:Protein of unknown function (DUF2637)
MTTGTDPTATSAEVTAPYLPGEDLTRRAVTVITVLIALLSFAFSLGNVTALALYLGIPDYIAWLIGPSVDLSVLGLLIGLRYLALRGCTDKELRKPRCLMLFSGLLTLALNVAHSVAAQRYGTALVDAVGPSLLIGWGETGPWLLRQIYAARPNPSPHGADPQHDRQLATAELTTEHHASDLASDGPSAPSTQLDTADDTASTNQPQSWTAPQELLAAARMLNAKHLMKTGRPISRDNLRAELSIGRDRAASIVKTLRAEQSRRAVAEAQRAAVS